jgi:PKD repeat protein
MKKQLLLLMVILGLLPGLTAQSNLFIDNSYSAEQMVMDFFDGNCVTPSNISFSGDTMMMAYFEAANAGIGINAGILLSSGNVFDAPGPNSQGATSSAFDQPGDSTLSEMIGGLVTFDAAILEMQIVPETDTLCFYYLFASEEYPEYVGSSFNDAFAFFIAGPGITDTMNIATVPGSSELVAINTVNGMMNMQYYQDNAGGQEVEYDGMTTLLPAKAVVTPFETYYVKIVVADASDQIFDSGVFLGIESLCGDSLLTPPAEFAITVSGDSVLIQNDSRYATSYLWDFGDNFTSTERDPGIHEYQEAGEYTITLITQNWCCADTMSVDVEIEEVVSTKEIDQKDSFQISPNPARDHVWVDMGDQNGTLTLFDASGRVVLEKVGNGNVQLSLSELQPGLFTVRLTRGDQVLVQKLLKN